MLGGGLAARLTSFSILVLAAIDLLKVEDLAEFNPTFGERLNKLTSSAGEGVASISPVEAPFMAEAI